MRELTAAQADDLYELITEPDHQPGARRLVPPVPQPRRRRIPPRPAYQHSHQVFMNGPSYRPNNGPGRVIPTGTTSSN
jgi:hypothetical protein